MATAGPASAVDYGSETDPNASFGVVSWLTPTHLGNHVVAEAAGTIFEGDPAAACWERFDHTLNSNRPPEWEPDETDILVAMWLLPSECQSRLAVQLTEPTVLDNPCDTGTVFAIQGTTRWQPGTPFDPPGRFEFTGLTDSSIVNELVFGTCLEVFEPDDDIADTITNVPEPSFHKSPDIVGLTGLDTWLWYDFTDPASHHLQATTTINRIRGLPLTIDAQAWVDQILWDLDGDGEWDTSLEIPQTAWNQPPDYGTYLTAGGANTADDAATTWTYQTKGEYTVTVGVVWHGVYTVTTPQFGGTYPYPSVTRTQTFPYQVCEIRAVHTQPGQRPNLDTCPLP